MKDISRRDILALTAAGGLITAAAPARADVVLDLVGGIM